MKQTRYIHKGLFLFYWGMLAAIWSGCTNETTLPEEKGAITFQLSLPPALEVTTRSKELGGAAINDVWVLQYNASSKAFIKGANFSGGDIGDTQTNKTINVTTTGFSNVESNFYIIVNAGTSFLTDFIKETTADRAEATLKKKTVAITAGAKDQPALLTCGPLKYSPDTSGKVVLVAPLQHPCARIVVQWNTTPDFEGAIEITSVKVKNLPNQMALYSRGGETLSKSYPELGNINTNFVSISASLASNTDCSFYMAENLRGTGTATSFSEKGLEGKGPGTNGTLEGCTCVVLTGKYKYPNPAGGQYAGEVGVEYCIYLGGNLLKDYNIQRGYEYKLTVNISGINSGDIRVTITDGAVVVFDDVVTITKDVEFK